MKQSIQLMALGHDSELFLETREKCLYFDEWVAVKLKTPNEEYLLLEDVLGYVVSELYFHFFQKKESNIEPELMSLDIGLLRNEYYYWDGLVPLGDRILERAFQTTDDNHWIGSRYCCFESREICTWVYPIQGLLRLKLTPNYPWHYEEEAEYSYQEFRENYRVFYERSLSSSEVEQCQKNILKIKNALIY